MCGPQVRFCERGPRATGAPYSTVHSGAGGQRRPRASTWSTTSEMTSSAGNSSLSPTSPKRLVEGPHGQSARARRAAAERRAVHRPFCAVPPLGQGVSGGGLDGRQREARAR